MAPPINCSSNPNNVPQYGNPHEFSARDQECRNSQASQPPTPYMFMLIQANEVPKLDDILSAAYSWTTLAGFLVIPGTFTSLKNSDSFGNSKSGKVVQDAVQNIPLLPLVALCGLVGTVGSCWLWWKWRKNYVWLIARIFLRGLLHSFIGLITTLINVYTAHGGYWSLTAKITIVFVAFYLVSTTTLTLMYKWLLAKIRTPQDKKLATSRER